MRVLGRKTGRIGVLPVPPPLSGWTNSRDIPRPPAQTFREWWKERPRSGEDVPQPAPSDGSDRAGRGRKRSGR